MGATVNPPKPPPFYPIDIKATTSQALQADVNSYNLSDSDFASRFPGLVTARSYLMDQANQDLNGPLDPEIQGGLVRQGIEQSLSSFGGGNPMGDVTQAGSAGSNTAEASIGRGLLANQDANRQYSSFLRTQNPERAFGLSGKDIAQLSIFNTGNANQSTQNNLSAQIAGINGQAAQNQQNAQLIAGIISSAAGAYGRYNNPGGSAGGGGGGGGG